MLKHITYIAITILVVAPTSAQGQDASELFEQGLYTEEVIGDLNEAIVIYNRVFGKPSSRYIAADAMLRLGLCYFKLGDKKHARVLWHNLIKNYPNRIELINLARRYMPDLHPTGLILQDAPWSDGEILQYEIQSPTGKIRGGTIITTNQISTNEQTGWRIERHDIDNVDIYGQIFRRIDTVSQGFFPQSALVKTARGDAHDITYGKIEETFAPLALNTISDWIENQVINQKKTFPS